MFRTIGPVEADRGEGSDVKVGAKVGGGFAIDGEGSRDRILDGTPVGLKSFRCIAGMVRDGSQRRGA